MAKFKVTHIHTQTMVVDADDADAAETLALSLPDEEWTDEGYDTYAEDDEDEQEGGVA